MKDLFLEQWGTGACQVPPERSASAPLGGPASPFATPPSSPFAAPVSPLCALQSSGSKPVAQPINVQIESTKSAADALADVGKDMESVAQDTQASTDGLNLIAGLAFDKLRGAIEEAVSNIESMSEKVGGQSKDLVSAVDGLVAADKEAAAKMDGR
ncbi:hypothetical protein GA0061078_1224 [Bifidobacterium bohemicum]|uniref:Uncharacterized protein n=1 Tax=Bifidobacterium bohemicum DSM 22767 TaxID=1437606 RepID=A0A086ZG82_9BIFI|nr:hypothetical protein BBOH_1057 [Bifidobacterium bohemicum DSM 22767]SCC02674.1 hypothetical protein GA0061078_1224 [Bifidobacterium bohemicum]